MGLLDSLFNQSTYGGQGGGLLDFLRTTQMQQDQYQPSAGFPGQASPIGVGGYQMPRIGDMAQFTPQPQDPAALPPNAQPTQGQLPPPQQGQDFGSNVLTGLQSFLNGGGLISAIRGAANGQRSDPVGVAQQNQRALFQAYKEAGLTPQQAMVAVLNPQAAQTFLGGGQTDDIKEYQFAKKENPSLTFEKFMLGKRASSGEYSLNPTYTYNEKTKETEAWQLGKNGQPVKVQFPEGSKVAAGTDKVDAGTHWDIYDKRSGVKVGTMPKDVAGKEAAEKRGQAQGTAQAALANGADIDAAATIKKIDEFARSKGFNEVFGQLDQYRPSWTHSNAGTDALARYEQLTGTAFLSAYQMLKGGGAITDIEGQKAGAAMARLNRAQSEAEARVALRDFREAVETGLQKLKRAANGGVESAPVASAPPSGNSVDALLKKYGSQ